MARPKTSAEQYAPVQDAERYLDSKGGVLPADEGAIDAKGRQGKEPRRPLESPVEAERHAAEVGNEAKKQRRTKTEQA